MTEHSVDEEEKRKEHRRHEDCEKCKEHLLWEEKVDKIPILLSWMNFSKGTLVLAVILFTTMFGVVLNSRSEMGEKQKLHEQAIKEQAAVTLSQVRAIGDSVSAIQMSVAVMAETYRLTLQQIAKELEDNRQAIIELKNEQNIRRNSGKQ